MSTTSALQSRRVRGTVGTILGVALVFSAALPATAIDRPADDDGPVATQPRTAGTPTFTPDLQTDIHIGDEVQPSDFVSSPDGKWGYVVARELQEFVVINMSTREVEKRIAIPTEGGAFIRVSADGTRAYFALQQQYTSVGIGVIDLTAGTYVTTLASTPDNIQEIVVAQDGSTLHVLNLDGDVVRLDATTGAELAHTKLPGTNFYGLARIDDGNTVLVGRGTTVYRLDPTTLAELSSFTVPGVNAVAHFRVDTTDERVYFTDAQGSGLGVFNPKTGDLTSLVSVGNVMDEVIGFDDLNRSFGNVPYWDYLMAADHATGKRSESVRVMPDAPFSMSKNPVTRDLLSANGGWSNAEKGSTVSIVNAPSVSDPNDAAVTRVGDSVRFETEAVGIKRGHGGGIIWQSSPDGETWTDLEGETFEQLDVVADADTVKLEYRVRYYDDFWGQRGASAGARITAPAPKITFDAPLKDGIVGEAYPATQFTATGQDDLAWETPQATKATVSGLPDGMTFDLADATLSGTPTEAGTYTFVVRVTDAFGEDSREYSLTVTDDEDPTGPTTPPTDPGTPPTGPTGPNAGGESGKGSLSDTGGVSPLLLSLIAAGIVAAGGAGIVFARRGRGRAGI